MSKKNLCDPLVKNILDDLKSRFSDHIVSVFGIGSYFDDNLPSNWIKNDIDLVVIVDSLEHIPKQDWTEVRYEKKQIGDKEIWIGFNTLEGIKNWEQFRKEFFLFILRNYNSNKMKRKGKRRLLRPRPNKKVRNKIGGGV